MTHRPALVIAAALAAGMGTEGALGPVPFLFMAAGTLGIVLAATFFRKTLWDAVLCTLVFVCGAFAAWGAGLLPADHVSLRMERLKGHPAEAVCRITSPVEDRTGGLAPRKVFACDLEQVNGRRCSGRVIVNLFGPGHFMYGDRVRLAGKLARPFEVAPSGRTSYRAYLARQGVHAILHVKKAAPRTLLAPSGGGRFAGAALALRRHLQGIFFRYLSPGEAGLMNAMLLGPRGDIPGHVYDVFRRTGTAHIIAISGMNMTLTAVGVMFLLGLFAVPRVPRAVLAAAILAFYACMAGNSAPVTRAAVMAAAMILSFVIERETDALNSLGLAALVLLGAAPGLRSDVGAQLSFVCVVSLIVLTPLILAPFERSGWGRNRVAWFFLESAAVTLAAFIGSAGILAYDFGYLAPVGLVVNLPVIPLMALVTALGAGLLAAGAVLPWAAGYFAVCLKVVLNAAVGVLTLAAHAPVLACPGIAAGWVILYYVFLILGAVLLQRAAGGRGFIDKPLPL